jgi:hypothetical protein
MNILTLSALLLIGPRSGPQQADQWIDATSKSYGFSVSMPGRPTLKPSVAIQVPNGKMYIHRFEYLTQSEFFIAIFAEAPPGSRANPTEQEIVRLRDIIAKESRGSIVSQNRFSYAGKQVLEMAIDGPMGVSMIVRIFIGDRRFYFLGAASRIELQDNPDIRRFFDSFRILSKSSNKPKRSARK